MSYFTILVRLFTNWESDNFLDANISESFTGNEMYWNPTPENMK